MHPDIDKLRVSSVLNKNTKDFGGKFMLDGSGETCWNSDQGSPQDITITFKEAFMMSKIRIMFQGGFVGVNCEIWIQKQDEDCLLIHRPFYPLDNNHMQTFDLLEQSSITKLKIVFKDSTDFYGRITIYKLEIL
ncbi:nuclear receptor 2C2-associated protein [Acrasis kona]|uniref:Nuclear receptor 2C2-associated protein n=1 Tax=Acrasis kona TaxID=1008807 RepID=A0AAW2ZGB5_9EUKA